MKRRRKESGHRWIPAESRAKKRRPLPRTSHITTPQVMLHVVTVLAELAERDQRGVIIWSLGHDLFGQPKPNVFDLFCKYHLNKNAKKYTSKENVSMQELHVPC